MWHTWKFRDFQVRFAWGQMPLFFIREILPLFLSLIIVFIHLYTIYIQFTQCTMYWIYWISFNSSATIGIWSFNCQWVSDNTEYQGSKQFGVWHLSSFTILTIVLHLLALLITEFGRKPYIYNITIGRW